MSGNLLIQWLLSDFRLPAVYQLAKCSRVFLICAQAKEVSQRECGSFPLQILTLCRLIAQVETQIVLGKWMPAKNLNLLLVESSAACRNALSWCTVAWHAEQSVKRVR